MSHLGFKARVGSLIYTWQRHTCCMRFTSRPTHADLFVASMAAKSISSHTCKQALWGSKLGGNHFIEFILLFNMNQYKNANIAKLLCDVTPGF